MVSSAITVKRAFVLAPVPVNFVSTSGYWTVTGPVCKISTERQRPILESGGGGAQSTKVMARSVELLSGGNTLSTGRKTWTVRMRREERRREGRKGG